MGINNLRPTPQGDIEKFAWSGLSKYKNTEYTKNILISRHNIAKNLHHFAEKQARQIRYCLIQAEQYFSAAKSVEMSTRPVLIYYGIMSLALAEILIKGSGEVSLDRARTSHRHHGLTLHVKDDPSKAQSLIQCASALSASPLIVSGSRRGTFNLWWSSSRETPVSGLITKHYDQHSQKGAGCLLASNEDEPLEPMPDNGVSLLHCLKNFPYLANELIDFDIASEICRGTISLDINTINNRMIYKFIVHPNGSNALDDLYEGIKFAPNCMENLTINLLKSGVSVSAELEIGSKKNFRLPNSFQWYEDEILLCSKNQSLNEMGIYYITAYIMGNYARYYPDYWMLEIENANHLFQICHSIFETIQIRAPLLCYAELDQKYILINK